MRIDISSGVAALMLTGFVLTGLAGCAQQPMLSAGTPLNGPVALRQQQAVAGWQGHGAGPSGAENDGASAAANGAPGKPRSRAGRVLAAIALERVTGRSIDPGRLVEP